MSNDIQNILSAWPFRYYIIIYDSENNCYKFKSIGEPENAEFDLTKVFDEYN